MDTETIYRTTLNGANWMIIKDCLGVSLFVKPYGTKDFYFSGNIFRSVDDAKAHLDKIDERISKPIDTKPVTVPADYYGVAGRYYGD